MGEGTGSLASEEAITNALLITQSLQIHGSTWASCGTWKASILSVKYVVSCLSSSPKLSCKTWSMWSVSRRTWSCFSKEICLLSAYIGEKIEPLVTQYKYKQPDIRKPICLATKKRNRSTSSRYKPTVEINSNVNTKRVFLESYISCGELLIFTSLYIQWQYIKMLRFPN